jgi:hypothetical protein
METITIRPTVTTEGTIVLNDLPVRPGDDVEIEVRIRSAGDRPSSAAPVDLSRFAGTLKTTVDPVEFQKQIRAEWDR